MNRLLGILIIFITFNSCKNSEKKDIKTEYQEITKDDYELSKPVKNIEKVLVLFGGFPEVIKDIKREFKIIEIAKENNITVIYMNYNKKLWLKKNEKDELAEKLENIFTENKLPTNEVYIGGFSSGGNVSLLISGFLIENKKFKIKPKGVFIADSPIDLIALYKSSEKNIEKNFSELAVQESNWIIETLEENFGKPKDSLSKYENSAVFTSETNAINNLKSLKNTKIRLYTEPDKVWWKKNRMADYDQTNAYYIKQLSETLKKSGFNKVEYIPTENKGYRANGERHPHSWSIIDKKDLIKWITK
jgi:hypothetical protein